VVFGVIVASNPNPAFFLALRCRRASSMKGHSEVHSEQPKQFVQVHFFGLLLYFGLLHQSAHAGGGDDGGDGGAGGNGGKPMTLSAVSVEPLVSALSRVASVKSMVAAPYKYLALAVSFEPLRSVLARLALVKSMVAS